LTGIFKANNVYNAFLLFVYGLLLKIPIFLRPVVPHTQQTDGFLYRGLLGWLELFGKSLPVIYPVICYLLLYTQAITFNRLSNELRLMQKPNYLAGMSYLLVTSLFSEWNSLSAPLIINTLLIWVWARMASLNTNPNPRTTLFNIGMAIGLSTFFYFPSIAFSALIIFGLALTRPFKLAEWMTALLGIITPYYFLLAWVFLTDKWKGYRFPGFTISSPRFNQTNWSYIAILVVVLFSILGFFYIQQNFRRQLIQVRKSWNLVLLYLLVAIFVPFVNATHTFEYWILCAVPLSAYMGAAFFYPDKKIFPQLVHWLMVAFVILINYLVK